MEVKNICCIIIHTCTQYTHVHVKIMMSYEVYKRGTTLAHIYYS